VPLPSKGFYTSIFSDLEWQFLVRRRLLDSSLVRKNKLILKKRVEALLKNLGERRIINNEEIIKLAGLKERKKEFGRLKEENKMITKFMDDFIDKIETGASLAR